MKKTLLILFAGLVASGASAQKTMELLSPNKEIKVEIRLADKIYYSVFYNDFLLLQDNYLQMTVGSEVLGANPKLYRQKRTSVSEQLTPVVPLKFSTVDSEYNQLAMTFRGDYSVEFRAFDDGIAYRFITDKKGEIEVMGEDIAVNFPADYLLHLQQPGSFKTSQEEPYTHVNSGEWKTDDKISENPILIDTRKDYKILLAETDLFDYPGMFFKSTGKNNMISTFPKAPLKFGDDGDRSLKILEEADYIAKTNGKRSFPWRYFVITKEDGLLIENTMSYKLAGKSVIETSWIKPGQVSWEWWNDAAPYGPDVDFVSGYNLATYKYYIDFASKYGIDYILMDEGWAKSTRDPYTPNPDVDVHEIIRYGKEKNVGVVLWLTWLVVENNMDDLFRTLSAWGVKGIKIDFMDRADQWMVNYYERVAKAAAEHNLFVDFHGSYKPSGLEYKYPNVLSYEGVRGMEQMGWCTPDNSVYFPFIRNAVGPMDYTPGAMFSMQPDKYSAQRPNAGSIGTRAYQMALYVIFESGLQMLADNPTLYYRSPDCTEFITSVPTTWDETRALEAKVGEYSIVAKRKGDKWFIGGMTNNKEQVREFTISLDFLSDGKEYKMTSFVDGINAGRQAMDYSKEEASAKKGDTVKIKMVRNGGFAAVIE